MEKLEATKDGILGATQKKMLSLYSLNKSIVIKLR